MTPTDSQARLDVETRHGRRTLDALDDLVTFGDMAARLVARGKRAFQTDEALRLASEAIIHRIGEAANRLPTGFQEEHPDIPWRELIGLRVLIAHIYHRVDHDMLWNALSAELPADIDYIRRLLSGQPPWPGTPGSRSP